MKKSEWSDKQLEDLLRQMPKIQDHRNPRDIYQNLSIKKRRKFTWLVPSIATVAALLLFFLLVPKLLDEPNYSLNSTHQEDSGSTENISLSEDRSSQMMKKEDNPRKDNETLDTESKMLMNENTTALYDDEVGDGTVITYWIPDAQAQFLVPVSIVVKPDENKDWLTVFTESMELLKEEEWGLTDYCPLNAKFELDTANNTVVVDVPKDHRYGQGSTSEMNFLTLMKKNIASNSQINKIRLTTNGNLGIEFGNFGVIEEINVEPEGKHGYFIYSPEGLETTYLVPSNQTYPDISAALEAMKLDQSDLGLTASLGPSFPFKDIKIQDNKLVITIDKNSVIANDPVNVAAYEAILLTAKEFGMESITILNAPIKNLGPFDLTQETKVPLAANHLYIQ